MPENEKKQPSSLAVRVTTAIPLIVLTVVGIWLSGWPFAVLFSSCLVMAVYEELRALEQAGHKPLWWTSFCAVAVDLAVALAMVFAEKTPNPMFLLLPSYALLIFVTTFLIMRRQKPELTDITMSVLPMLSIGVPGMCLMGVLGLKMTFEGLPVPGISKLLLVQIFAIALVGDTFAYFTGSLIGGPKLCPAISPKKTIAGAIGSIVGSIGAALLIGAVYGWIFGHRISFVWADAVCGLMGGIAGMMGDLFASMIKRHCGIKDFSNLFPGHGGMLDRIDSVLFTAVIVYSYGLLLPVLSNL